jgi:xanthine dehydrogenase YagS FAD-binding subunit
MNPFSYARPAGIDEALALAQSGEVRFLAGGTNLVDLMKDGVESPARLIDLGRLPLAAIEALPERGLRIGALARNSDAADHPLVRTRYPLITQAIVSGATQQLRNMATIGGNLLQRTRCHYFCDTAFRMCNKRAPGSGCAALEGENRQHAILGASAHCVATHPSDLCVALAALEATVRVRGPAGARTIPFQEFHRLPENEPYLDTTLAPGELIVAVDLPPSPFAAHSHYLKVRERASFAFALVSVAAALHIDDGAVREARIALGGVAHKPWRAFEAERTLLGGPLDEDAFRQAADVALRDAKPLARNAFKIELARRGIVRALTSAAGGRA